MAVSIADLLEEHRTIEAALDDFAAGPPDLRRFLAVQELVAQHYRREGQLLAALREHEPAFADKLSAQHEEVLEIAARLEESWAAGQAGDVERLTRRFLALAQHNLIEAERDVFPVAERCFRGVLTASLVAKIEEQIERTVHLVGLAPREQLEWAPPMEGAWPIAVVLGHLLECLAGFCAVLHAAYPERLRHFVELRNLPVNHQCAPDEARGRIELYGRRLNEGFPLLTDADLSRKIPTAFVPSGETLLTLLLGNLEHLINHKHQLFLYLRLMGVPVSSADLYRFRE